MDQQLSQLEESVCHIMEIAQATLEKLKSLPLCNEQEISDLSIEYTRVVGEVQQKLKSCSCDILSSSLIPDKAQYGTMLKEFAESQVADLNCSSNDAK